MDAYLQSNVQHTRHSKRACAWVAMMLLYAEQQQSANPSISVLFQMLVLAYGTPLCMRFSLCFLNLRPVAPMANQQHQQPN
jgi:hypothetical protein